MARQKREEIGQPDDPNLAPFMNLVIILIPMLLLSVVFLEVAVINVTMPLGGSATTDDPDEDDKESLDLAIAMSPNGFYVTAAGSLRQPIEGCPTQGPTICLSDDSVNVQERFEEARRMMADGNETAGEQVMEEGLQAYNYRELYNMLSGFKADFPEETTVRLTADENMPFALTVRVMDVSRYRLTDDSYHSDEDFWKADFQTETTDAGEEQFANLFGDPAFAVAQ